MKKAAAQKPVLYFMQNEADKSYWDGSYHYENHQRYSDKGNKDIGPGWNTRVRFFKSAAALVSSLNKLPKSFIDLFVLEFPKPTPPPPGSSKEMMEAGYREESRWHWSKHEKWHAFIKDKKLTSIDRLRIFEAQGWKTFIMEEGKSLRSAKPL